MAFTVHGLDRKLDEKLSARARKEGMSKNQFVKRLIARAMGMASGDKEADDYREFLGTWTDEDLRAFTRAQLENSRIDPGDWQ